MTLKTAGAIVLATTLSTLIVNATVTHHGSYAQTGDPLVYVCPANQGPADPQCTNSQEFEIFDHNGAPIFSVGEFGGSATFGDNSSVYPPGSVTKPAVVNSYTTPAKYGQTTCKAPAVWIAPQGIWTCTSAGTWTHRSSFTSHRAMRHR